MCISDDFHTPELIFSFFDDTIDKDCHLTNLYLLSGKQGNIAGYSTFDFRKAQREIRISEKALYHSLNELCMQDIIMHDPMDGELLHLDWFEHHPIGSNQTVAEIINLYIEDHLPPHSHFTMTTFLSKLLQAITEQNKFKCDNLLSDFLVKEITRRKNGDTTPPHAPPFSFTSGPHYGC